jgi:hypothetical protein
VLVVEDDPLIAPALEQTLTAARQVGNVHEFRLSAVNAETSGFQG